MSTDLTSAEYFAGCKSLALDIATEAMEEAEGDRDNAHDLLHDKLHEAIDGDALVIYYAGNDTILRHTANAEAYAECYDNEALGEVVKKEGLDKVKTIQAFFAMQADVQDYLTEALDEAEEAYAKDHPEAKV